MFPSTPTKITGTALLLAALTSAAPLSTTCETALQGLVLNSDASCLNIIALAPLVLGNSNDSVVPTINSWLTGICGSAPCTNSSLETVTRLVFTACQTELALPAETNLPDTFVQYVQSAYPTVRKVACLKNDSADTLCTTEFLNNAEDITGPLSLDTILSGGFLAPFTNNSNLTTSTYSNVTCTACSKQELNVIRSDFPELAPQADEQFSDICGADFIDGTAADGVSETAQAEDASTDTNGVAASAPLSVALVGASAFVAWIAL